MPDTQLTLEQLLAAGVHFGHQTRRWNPKMRRFIFAERNGIHIIDLQKTMHQVELAQKLTREGVLRGENVLFVCTKPQLSGLVKEAAERCGAMYINQLWLGGLLPGRIQAARAPALTGFTGSRNWPSSDQRRHVEVQATDATSAPGHSVAPPGNSGRRGA